MNRGSLPAHLPCIEMVVDIESHTCPSIAEDTSERLDIVPAQFRVLVVRRPKFGCRICQNVVVQAAAPGRLIDGGSRLSAPWHRSWSPNMPIIFRFIGRLENLRSTGHRTRPFDTGRLGRACSLLVATGS